MSLVMMRKKMHGWSKWVMLGLAVVFAIGFIAISIGTQGMRSGTDQPAPGAIARVNGQNLNGEEFDARFREQVRQMSQRMNVSRMMETSIRDQLFDEYVDRTLKLQAAREMGIRVSRGDINKHIDQFIDQQMGQLRSMMNQGRKKKISDDMFDRELARLGYASNAREMKSKIRDSIDRQQLEQSLILQKLSGEIKKKVDTSDKALHASFNEVRLRQITISPRNRTPVQAEQQAKDLVAKLRGGADFAAMARANSDDQLRATGGDYGGYIKLSMLESLVPPEVARAAGRLQMKEISDPIKTDSGYVILKLEDKRIMLPPGYDDPAKRSEIRRNFAMQQQSMAEQKFYAELRRKAKIEVFDPELKAHMLVMEANSVYGPDAMRQRKDRILKAISQYKEAINTAGQRDDVIARSYVQIAMLYQDLKGPMMSPTPEETKKYNADMMAALEDALKVTEDTQIRMMLGKLYVDAGQNAKAVEVLEIASVNAFDDWRTHEELITLYKQMKRDDLVAREQKWLAENKARLMEESQQAQPGGMGPTGGPPSGG